MFIKPLDILTVTVWVREAVTISFVYCNTICTLAVYLIMVSTTDNCGFCIQLFYAEYILVPFMRWFWLRQTLSWFMTALPQAVIFYHLSNMWSYYRFKSPVCHNIVLPLLPPRWPMCLFCCYLSCEKWIQIFTCPFILEQVIFMKMWSESVSMRTSPILGMSSAVMQEVDHQKEFLCLDVQSCVNLEQTSIDGIKCVQPNCGLDAQWTAIQLHLDLQITRLCLLQANNWKEICTPVLQLGLLFEWLHPY
jgi:hypothetical protein